MDWITIGALALIGVVAILISWLSSRWHRQEPSETSEAEALRTKQQDINKGASWQNMGL